MSPISIGPIIIRTGQNTNILASHSDLISETGEETSVTTFTSHSTNSNATSNLSGHPAVNEFNSAPIGEEDSVTAAATRYFRFNK